MQDCKNREHFGSSLMPCTMLEVWDLPFIKFPTHQPVWPQWFWGIFLANSNWFYRTIIAIFAQVFLPQQFVPIPQSCTLEHSTRKWHYLHISMTEFELWILIHIPLHIPLLTAPTVWRASTSHGQNKLLLQAFPDCALPVLCMCHFSWKFKELHIFEIYNLLLALAEDDRAMKKYERGSHWLTH